MTVPLLVKRGPGQRPQPYGAVDRLRVASPWMWTGLCNAITASDGSLRDWVIGAPPSVYSTATPGRDPRGGEVLTFSGSAVQYQEFAPTGLQQLPSTAITVYLRWKHSGVSGSTTGFFAKPYQTTTPFDTWLFQQSTNNTSTLSAGLTVGSTLTSTPVCAAVGTTAFTNFWLRWTTGAKVTMDSLKDDGTAVVAQVASAAVASGTIGYPATRIGIRVGGLEVTTRNSAGGDFSAGLVWNRYLSDQEMVAATIDPFGFLRRG
jgi:hypothetical protein